MDIFDTLLALAIQEDLGQEGDVTSQAIFRDQNGAAELVSKDSGVLAGSNQFTRTFHKLDPGVDVSFQARDGDSLEPGMVVARLAGRIRSILSAERIALNFLSFLSGIATITGKYVAQARAHGKALILDTRKTLPAYRELSKYAVRVGGGRNHRLGLYDMVMIKDNHIDAAGSIGEAVSRVRGRWGKRYRIEVECRNLKEVRAALDAGVDMIMLDNMDKENSFRACELGQGRAEFEASGNMDLKGVADFSPCGVDYISVGRLTHSVAAFDFSLRIKQKGGNHG